MNVYLINHTIYHAMKELGEIGVCPVQIGGLAVQLNVRKAVTRLAAVYRIDHKL